LRSEIIGQWQMPSALAQPHPGAQVIPAWQKGLSSVFAVVFFGSSVMLIVS
jgi:hypothetical protein